MQWFYYNFMKAARNVPVKIPIANKFPDLQDNQNPNCHIPEPDLNIKRYISRLIFTNTKLRFLQYM